MVVPLGIFLPRLSNETNVWPIHPALLITSFVGVGSGADGSKKVMFWPVLDVFLGVVGWIR